MAFRCAALLAAPLAGAAQLALGQELSEAALPGDETCDLSLRQLRGDLRVDVAAEAAAAATESGAVSAQGACHSLGHGSFSENSYQCGLSAGGQAAAAGSCMAKKQGVSSACGACMGKLINCGMNCISECCTGNC